MNTIARFEETALGRRAAASILLAACFLIATPSIRAQGSRKDDVVFGPSGRPVAGATVQVCQPNATGTPCSPLATIYTDGTLTVAAPNPFQTDGLGNYHFYAPAGRYEIQISSPQISGTITEPDVILPADLSSSAAGNNISAFGLTLGGNLNVAGNAIVSGTLSSSSLNPGPLTSLTVTGNTSLQGPRPYIDVTAPAYGAAGDGGAEATTGSITSGSSALTVASATGFKVGMGVHVDGAGASSDVLLAKITAINGSILTLSANAGTTVSGAGVGDDDTLAIQEAMAAFCAGGVSGGGSIYFPPGEYIFSQNQSSNPNAVPFTVGCQGMHFLGGNARVQPAAFVHPPQVSINGHCGPSMNAQPAFLVAYPNQNAAFENLIINGCNQSVSVPGQVVRFKDTTLAVSQTGLTDNTPLHIWDTFWVWFDGGGLVTNSTTAIPSLLMTADACSGCYIGVGNIYMSNMLIAGGPIEYIQRANQSGANSGHWVFRNITQESGNGDLLQITDPGSFSTGFGAITMDDVQQSDNMSSTGVLVSINIPSASTLSGVYINNSASASNAVMRVLSGHVDDYYVSGCVDGGDCSNAVVNSSGTPQGSGVFHARLGLDVVADMTVDSSAGHLYTMPYGVFGNANGNGPAFRAVQSGSNFASYMIDALEGFGFGSNTQAGWNAQIFQSTAPNIDVAFAANFPPTSVSATVSNTGGSIITGTYYLYMVSTTNGSCSMASGFSAPSAIVGPYTVGAGVTTASFNVSWAAAAPGASAINGYCLIAGSAQQYNIANSASAFISGASTASATVGSFPNTPGAFPITYNMVQEDHLTPTYAVLNGAATPLVTANPPYVPACLAAITCSAYIPLSPIVADTFARTNAATLGANWSPAIGTSGWTALQIISNAAEAPGVNPGFQSWISQLFLPDQFAKATVGTFANGSSDQVGVGVRGTGTSTNTEYLFLCSNGNSFIRKWVAGSNTDFSFSGVACASGNTIELDVAGTQLYGLINGTVVTTVSDSSIASGYPGVFAWGGDNVTNFVGGSLPAGNGAQAIFDQPNTWVKPQTFASPITSASLAAPNKTRTCNIVRGDQSGSALSTGNIQPQGSLCYVDAAATVTQVIVMVDTGASTAQIGYRHNGSTTAISPTLTPAAVTGITDHVACANAGGTAISIEGNNVTCSTLSNTALALGDFVETIGGAADGTSKRMSIALTYTVN